MIARLALASVLAAVVVAQCDDSVRGGRAAAIPVTDAAAVARGKALYEKNCASCHGTRLEGQADWRRRLPNGRFPAPPHDRTGHTWHHPDDLLFGITKEGMEKFAPPGHVSDMPAFGRLLSDGDIRATLAYIESRWPEEVWKARREMLKNRNP
ncbi:MAG TPA: cytochrome C oxidase Cbb3 [Rhodocyclaceae bacterium]